MNCGIQKELNMQKKNFIRIINIVIIIERHLLQMSLLLCKDQERKGENIMYIKEFTEKYSAIATDRLKEDYLKDNLHIKTYLPFIEKDALAQSIIDATMYKFEDYTKEDGTIGRRKTNQIQVNSTAQMLLFYRIIIENYTDLEVETEGFYEEYDA